MERQLVSSSNLRSIGYDKSSKILEIEFHKSGVYQYLNVPEHIYTGLMSSYSKGTYFDDNIKSRFNFRKISN